MSAPNGVPDLVTNISSNKPYIGRFAPSPTGPLHFGSLVCALASYLHAKQNNGKWLVRIEDIDTPRANPQMVPIILNTLKAHGMHWDGSISFQSQRHHLYEQCLDALQKLDLLYGCACTRKEIKLRGKTYDGYCSDKKLPFKGHAIRYKHSQSSYTAKQAIFVKDEFWGEQIIDHPICKEDPVLKRADEIYAYHLAVVADDIEQDVTHIVRGLDLLETTVVHISLYKALRKTEPAYLHIPLVTHNKGEKLSKQNLALAIDDTIAYDNLCLALQCLGLEQKILPNKRNIEQLLAWAVVNWSSSMIPKQREILISTTNGVYSTIEYEKNN